MRLFHDDPATAAAQASQTNKGHGRIKTRTASISEDYLATLLSQFTKIQMQ